MYPGQLLAHFRKLNPKLKVTSFGDNGKLAGVELLTDEGWVKICGVDKNEIPEYPQWDEAGHIIKSGWRRVIKLLLAQKIITREGVRKEFGQRFFEKRNEPQWSPTIQVDPIKAKLESKIERDEALTKDEIMEMKDIVDSKTSDYKKAEAEEEKWFLETWKRTGKKPKVDTKPH